MDYSILDHDQNSMPAGSDLGPEPDVPKSAASRSPQGSVSAAMAAANAASGASSAPTPALCFPGEDGGHSLADMARRDLDAALQLLAERAQYITEASGAAIALRRGSAQNDMLCRASAGSNAPELGTLLSTEFGLSGESVRTRLALRCDNADRDPRVNREGCRQLGIASVAVLPIVSDDQVLGVFELFSGKINAFEERDLSALQRLGEMVETAVKLAHAAQSLPPEVFSEELTEKERTKTKTKEDQAEIVSEEGGEQPAVEVATEVVSALVPGEPVAADAPSAMPQPELPVPDSPLVPTPKKPMLWSAAVHAGSTVPQGPGPDQSHVPPVLRNLHKCQACGFPVSQGRTFCVECEEKQWRGQVRVPARPAPAQPAASATSDKPETIPAGGAKIEIAASASNSTFPPHAAATVDPATSGQSPQEAPSVITPIISPVVSPVQPRGQSSAISPSPDPAPQKSESPVERPSSKTLEHADLLFQSSEESWFSANKYIIGSLVIVAVVIVVIALIR
jgi:GAF domain-containing protein